ncbi:MAG: hypothetical protein WAV89_12255 [Ignavibacteriaceae bacterium]
MNIPLLDRSNYLKGLFITAKLDRQLSEKEKEILKKISDKLGFAKDFYDETVRGLLSNKYLAEDPIIFSDQNIAKSFVSDAVKLIYADGRVTESEIDWLKKTAKANLIDDDFLKNEIKISESSPKLLINNNDFALFSII